MSIKVKHHQARAQIQLYLNDGYTIHRALELVTISYDLSTDDIVIIQDMEVSFVLANIE